MKNILILGAGEFQVPIIEEAKKMGLNTIVVSPKGNYPGFKIADKKYYLDVKNKDKILEIAKRNDIDGVATDQTDIPVRTAAYIAEKLNIYGIGLKMANLFSNKFLMREKCRSIGIPVLDYRLVNNLKSARQYCHQIGYPTVIKPVDNQGSRGVSKINNDADLERNYDEARQYSLNNSVLIEEFVDGWEFVVDSLTVNYKYRSLIIGDTYHFKIKNKFIPNKRLFPTIIESKIKNKVLELDKKIIKEFGLKQGITFSEYLWDRKDDSIYLLEIGARGQAVYVSSDIIPMFTGFNINRFILNTSLGKDVKIKINEHADISAGYIAFYLPQGRIINMSGINELENTKGVIKHNLGSIKNGQQVDPFGDKSNRKTIIVKAGNRKELDNLIDMIKSILNIEVMTEKGIKNIIWD